MLTLLLLMQPEPVPSGPVSVFDEITPAKLLYAAAILVIAYLLVRLSTSFLDRLAQQAPRARFFFKLVASILRLSIWLVGIVIILFAVLQPSRDTLWAIVASIGIALGLGAQDLIRNIVGGLVLLVNRPYQMGDRVKIGDAYGEIDHIGLLSTKLTTPDDTRVTIPNGMVLGGMAWNANSGAPDCQVVTDLFLPHDTDPGPAMAIAYEIACTSPYVQLSKPVVVLVQDQFQRQPYLMVRVKAYVYDHRFEPRLQSDITARSKAEFRKRGMLWARKKELPEPISSPPPASLSGPEERKES